jgi:dTDP-glucose pyrophosphorylase
MAFYSIGVSEIYSVQADSEEQARELFEQGQARHIDTEYLIQKESE